MAARMHTEPPRCGIPPLTLICAAIVGGLMWVGLFWIARAVWGVVAGYMGSF